MIDPGEFRQRAEALSETLQAKLGVRGRGLETRLGRAGRRLPRRQRRAGREIVEAMRRMDHPKLARLMDRPSLDAAFESLSEHLKGIDPAERRRHALLSVLAVLVVNLLLLGLVLVVFMKWQGLV